MPQFKENQLTFGVAYGLCVQALDHAQLRTNLLPEEIVTTRLVKAKKPWAVAAVALLLLGMTINYFSHYSAWRTAALGKDNPAMEQRSERSKSVISNGPGDGVDAHDKLPPTFDNLVQVGNNLQSNVDGRLLWLELLKAIDTALPKDPRPIEERKETAEDVQTAPNCTSQRWTASIFPTFRSGANGASRYYIPSDEPEKAPAASAAPAGEQVAVVDGQAAAGTEAPADAAVAEARLEQKLHPPRLLLRRRPRLLRVPSIRTPIPTRLPRMAPPVALMPGQLSLAG